MCSHTNHGAKRSTAVWFCLCCDCLADTKTLLWNRIARSHPNGFGLWINRCPLFLSLSLLLLTQIPATSSGGWMGESFFSSEPISLRMDRRSPEAMKLREAVSKKLLEFLGNYSDDVLAVLLYLIRALSWSDGVEISFSCYNMRFIYLFVKFCTSWLNFSCWPIDVLAF